jgi:hypothetical protein
MKSLIVPSMWIVNALQFIVTTQKILISINCTSRDLSGSTRLDKLKDHNKWTLHRYYLT